MKPAWFVYILKCADDTFYTGVTTDLERRLKEHNDSKLGAKYTRVRRPVSIVLSESCSCRSTAYKREAAIKKLTRNGKLLLLKD
jgi:putative endonuclease